MEAVADLLVQRGYCFIPDAKLPEMRQALGPFLITPNSPRTAPGGRAFQ
jgi:hypothetical protein